MVSMKAMASQKLWHVFVPKYFPIMILIWAGTLLPVSVSSSCFALPSLTGDHGVLGILVNRINDGKQFHCKEK